MTPEATPLLLDRVVDVGGRYVAYAKNPALPKVEERLRD
jgi:hypothetical protein